MAQYRAWADSGMSRFQGGTIRGIRERLGYLRDLGVTAIWVGPVWKQRREGWTDDRGNHVDEYHGYAVQDFLDVDPRFGSRRDLVELVAEAHRLGMYVVLDIIINHSARNFLYADNGTTFPLAQDPPYRNEGYAFGGWLDRAGEVMPPGTPVGPDDAVWPEELRNPRAYHLKGELGDTNWGSSLDPDDNAAFRLGDMYGRGFDLDPRRTQVYASCSPAGRLDRPHRLRRIPDRHVEACVDQ